jgi:hypothetical protein
MCGSGRQDVVVSAKIFIGKDTLAADGVPDVLAVWIGGHVVDLGENIPEERN